MATRHRPRASTITVNHLRLIASRDINFPKVITTTLANALEAGDYSACLKNLHGIGIDPQSYIDGLDKAIDIISPGSDIHERCVRALSRACKIYGLLPDSHKVKTTLTLGQHAVASGGFSDVWKATDANGELFAIKVLRLYECNAPQVKKKFCREVVRSRWMNHPNVLRIEGVAPNLFPCCVVSRWMENGNMLEYLNQSQGYIDRPELLLGVIRGLNYLHSRKVVHGDLKSHNILIDAQGAPCLADFGLSSIARDIRSINGSDPAGGGSVRWSAPELVGSITARKDVLVKPTTRSDVYSLGMVVVEAFTGRIPFPNNTEAYVAMTISKGGRPPKPSYGESLGLGSGIWKLTEDCWNQNPGRRPDTANVLRRFQATLSAGEEKKSSPLIERIRSIGLSFDSVQQRINKLDQELEKGAVPENERPTKLSELCNLCGTNKLIPDSMKLQGYGNDNSEAKDYKGPSSMHQSKFKGRNVAVKVTRLYVSQKLGDPLGRFCKEAVAWKHLRHPNILPLIGATISKNRLCLISEWMDQGNIVQYLKTKESLEVNRIELLIDVVDGLSYMHGLHVVHGNLKGANIYIKNFRACIAGFSVSTIARVGQSAGTSNTTPIDSLPSFISGGSLRWMSPELLDPSRLDDRDPRPTKESDCFALGMVIYEVLCGHVPYEGWETERVNDAIIQGIRPYKPNEAAHLGLVDELWELLLCCWKGKREARPDLQAIRACLEAVVPLWHARADLSSTMVEDNDSIYTPSNHSLSLPPTPTFPASP